MKPNLDALKKKFRDGNRAEAITECEALCLRHPDRPEIGRLCATMHGITGNYARSLELLQQVREPGREDADLLFNIGVCERELKNHRAAEQTFSTFTARFPESADGWASLAECKFQLGEYSEGIAFADRALQLDASTVAAWTVRGHCHKALRQFDAAVASYAKANQIEPAGESFFNAGLALVELGKPSEAVANFNRAIALAPAGDGLLKRATVSLLEAGHGEQAIELCREILRVDPDNLTAKLGAEWILTQLVPLWHVPMMNEPERNQAFHDGLASAVTPEKVVFEIGTGSGLLAMMAARLGARKVFTCEAVGLIAGTASKIVARNGYQDRITVLAKPSHAVRIGTDLPDKADLLVHEIFSSELLGEHVLPAIEDAKERLLKPGGQILPASASIMIALVSGDALGKSLRVGDSFGFDLRDFNAIHPKKRPLYREDLAPVLLSDGIEAFRFDFQKQSTFPPERKRIEITTRTAGLCYGLIQWIRIELAPGVHFENHPGRPRPVSNWQHTVYGFEQPIDLVAGSVIGVAASHDRSRPWFALALTRREGGKRG